MENQVDQPTTSSETVEAIGYVRELTGQVIATDGNGIERILHTGDPVYTNDLIQTIAASTVVIDFIDGTHMNLGKQAQVLLDDEVFNPGFIGDTNRMVADVEAIQALILAGHDPVTVEEEPAAGVQEENNNGLFNDQNAGLGDGIIIDLTGQHTTPVSGYETRGLNTSHQQSRLELLKFSGNGKDDDTADVTDLTVAVTSFTTSDNTPEITGTVNNPSAKVVVVIDGTAYDATNNGDGTWTLDDDAVSDLDPGDIDVEVIVTDDGGNTTSSTGTITVINNDPTAAPDTKTAMEDGAPVNSVVPTTIDVDGDLDPNGYLLVTDVTEGALTFNPDGSYSFNPGPDFQDLAAGESRDVIFTYTASDTNGGTERTCHHYDYRNRYQ